jgi:hypothetical protein
MAATFNKFETFMLEVGQGNHAMHAAGDAYKAFLSNEQPLVGDDVIGDIAEVANVANETNHGAGGADIENDYTESSGQGIMTGVDKVYEAAGDTVGPFQFVVLYNVTGGLLVGWWDYGSAITLQVGETFTLDIGSEILTLGA